jgi:hypothetical protein
MFHHLCATNQSYNKTNWPSCRSNAFLLILWSGGISYVRPFFGNGRVQFSFLVYTISKNV